MRKSVYFSILLVTIILTFMALFVDNNLQTHYDARIKTKLNDLYQRRLKYHPVFRENGIQLWSTAQVIQRRDKSWVRMNQTLCSRKINFLEGTIKVKKHVTIPVFLHLPDDDVHISRVLLNGGSWEEDLLSKVGNVMSQNPSAIFIDIGAHIGVYSLTMASLGHKVIAVDCYSGNVERICASARRSNLSGKISIINNAVSDTRRNVQIKQTARSNIGSIAVVQTKQNENLEHVEIIPALQLDDLLEIFDIEFAVLKIDVEGHEDAVLKGAEKFFKKVDVKYVLTEFNFHKNKPSGRFIEMFMRRNRLHPNLHDNISQTNQTQWPWNVQWMKQNV